MRSGERSVLVKQIRDIYSRIKSQILSRIQLFENTWKNGSDRDLFFELIFCILTPATRARAAETAINLLNKKNFIFSGTPEQIAQVLNIVRFRNKKALSIVQARDQFFYSPTPLSLRDILCNFQNLQQLREWLAVHVSGIGYKESSHFLRNIGLCEGIAILDRHIMRNLFLLGVIEQVPGSLSKKRYLEIEEKLIAFSREIHIPESHLDFVLWFKETGDVFK
jgi:N-glycosylase/DNA lyase